MIVSLKNLKRIDLYTTGQSQKLRACDVRAKTGADVVINATLFDWNTWKPVCDVKDDGKVLSDDQYAYQGIAWNKNDDHFTPILTTDMGKWDNVVSCVMLIAEGKKQPIYANPDVARPAARTAVFCTKSGETLVYCDKKALTPDGLCELLYKRGDVEWALMLDGGGSSQLSMEGPDYVYSSRRVQNYLCFWLGSEVPDVDPFAYEPSIRAYSLSKDGNKQVGKHFKAREFRCQDGSDPIFIATMLPRVLDAIREYFDAATTITSGYRTPPHNRRVGGVPDSQHQYGLAADIVVPGHTPDEVGRVARAFMPNFGGVGVYPKKGFTHVDVRKKRSDWRG